MLLHREQRNIFHSSYFAFLHFGTVLHVWFINTVVCKDQADNLLQVFTVVRPQVAQKLRIQRWFQCGVSAWVFLPCAHPQILQVSDGSEYLCWAQMGLMALSSVGMGRTNNTMKNLSDKIHWIFLSFSLFSNNSVPCIRSSLTPLINKGLGPGKELSTGLTLGLELLQQISEAIVLSKRSKQEMGDRERKAQQD